MSQDLQTRSPAEIDEQLAELWYQRDRFASWAERAKKPNSPWREEAPRETRDREIRLAGYVAEIAALDEKIAPFVAEFNRRGGWERAFLVTNGNGHVHRTLSCSTCFPSTEFAWQTQLSGKTEAEIIAAIGMTACTICYPEAPVAKMTTAERRSYSRDQAAARKAEREAAKVAKEIAKIPRQHAEALKIDEFVEAFGTELGENRAAWSAAYESMWEGGRFAKGYSNAWNAWSDMVEAKARRAGR